MGRPLLSAVSSGMDCAASFSNPTAPPLSCDVPAYPRPMSELSPLFALGRIRAQSLDCFVSALPPPSL